tara:strand:- start:663 stop:1496 length:834 start_codon:yes stop_codon:yes gene_type:complete
MATTEVTAGVIKDGNVTTAKIADDAVTYAKMQHTATANRVLGATGAGVIGETQVVEAMIGNDAVGLTQMKAGVDGNIISYDASGNPVAIATGNDGQVLTSAGAGAPPAFEDAGGGGLWKFSSSGTIDANFFQVMGFSTDIRIEVDATTTTDGLNPTILFSTDGTNFLTSNYAYQVIHMTGGTFDNTYSNSAAGGVLTGGGIGSASGESFCWVFETMDAPNTATFIKTRTWMSFDHQGGAGSWTTGNIGNKAANNLNGVKISGAGLDGTYKIWTKVTS